jgi:hypothetical protein
VLFGGAPLGVLGDLARVAGRVGVTSNKEEVPVYFYILDEKAAAISHIYAG